MSSQNLAFYPRPQSPPKLVCRKDNHHVGSRPFSLMANTQVLKGAVEGFVRGALESEFGMPFEKKRLTLVRVEGPASDHEFDAVAKDGSVVAGIISSAARTSGGKRNTGAVHHATGELYYLILTDAHRRILICTDASFRDLMKSVTRGRLASGLEIRHVSLPDDLERNAQASRTASSLEMGARMQTGKNRTGEPPTTA